ncbi:MAG: hypothetical protein PHE51_00895 [Eubacteriales bacterium]|nr:hypothetical protein [Eubacteriales bacterium]
MMKKNLIICTLILFASLMLSGCVTEKQINLQTIKVYINMDRVGQYCAFEVNSNGTMKITTKNFEPGFLYLKIGDAYYFQEAKAKEKLMKLSETQMEEVDSLIKEVKKEIEDPREHTTIGIGSPYIQTYVNGQEWCCDLDTYSDIIPPNSLQRLTYKLVDIAPVKMPGVTSRIKLRELDKHFYWEYAQIFIRFGDERILRINILVVSVISIIIALFVVFVLKWLKKYNANKWIGIIPYVMCSAVVVLGYVNVNKVDGLMQYSDYPIRERWLYLMAYGIVTFIGIFLVLSVEQIITKLKKGEG